MPTERHALAAYLWQAVRWFDDGLQNGLRRQGLFLTTRTQSLTMGNISLGESRPSRLARSIGISPQAMSQVLRDLEDSGLISVTGDDADGRARIVRLTAAGEDYLVQVRPIFFQMEAELEERFSRPVIDIVRMVMEAKWPPPKSPLRDD